MSVLPDGTTEAGGMSQAKLCVLCCVFSYLYYEQTVLADTVCEGIMGSGNGRAIASRTTVASPFPTPYMYRYQSEAAGRTGHTPGAYCSGVGYHTCTDRQRLPLVGGVNESV